ncbi:hypothetical protein, conserved [Trypanosoma brucei gambiense DAL972]|uniref:E3 ubiquitin-protein ligase listerin n=1 Tax=Trypanosoma brucei gambiense (strain MHOM/CI/86/DAL972) TaxID=679716 RepID=D0A6Z8_TRYB9|nr:hypothetical protein, conserved [Trypanosoma brucei gambiense DAL972]CBH17449.1 hypothetical protein, conserved [Trypanosoma brucei gambiense DAL972]|eukprot:XP_011779713.1 hypothetical protein, conserved [Trypanosoma brucei gambiense DAL972]
MPPRPAKGRAALSFVASRGIPDSLESFLGDFSQPVKSNTEGSAMMEVNLKLLQKSNETTVLKALVELNRGASAMSEEELVHYLPQVVEAVVRHAEHSNASVRSGVFALLHEFLLRGSLLQQAVTKRLPKLASAWVTRMCDMEPSVRRDASDAFNAAYTTEVLKQHADSIVTDLISNYEEIIAQSRGKPLQDDTLDRRSNALYSCVCAMGHMLRVGAPASACHKVIEFVEGNSVQPIMPPPEGVTKGSMVVKAPVVRSASLILLRDILSSKLATLRVHQQVSTALYNAMSDRCAVVLRRAWELQLLWFGSDSSSALSHMQGGFLRVVMNSITDCNDPEVAEIIYPSLVPLLVPVTRSSAFASAIEEFSEVLQRKILNVSDVVQREWDLVLSSLMRVWELRCVRSAKLGEGHEREGATMFSSIVATLATALEQPARRGRLLSTTASVVAQTLERVARHTECFSECVQLLCGPTDSFSQRTGGGANAALVESFDVLQAALIGSSVSLPGVLVGAETLMAKYVEKKQWNILAELLQSMTDAYGSCVREEHAHSPVGIPSKEIQKLVTNGVLRAVRLSVSAERKDSDGVEPMHPLHRVLSYVLQWSDDDALSELQQIAATVGPGPFWLKDLLRSHELRDPERLITLFSKACEEADFRTVELCVDSLLGEQEVNPRPLTSAEKKGLRQAVQESLRKLHLLVSVDNDESEEEAEESSKEGDSGSGYDGSGAGDSSGDEGSEGAAEADGSGNEGDSNNGTLVQQQLIAWARFLGNGEPFASLLEVSSEDIDLPMVFRIVASIAPRLHAEQYMSIKALRMALQMEEDPLLVAMSKKIHSIDAKAFNVVVESIEQLLNSYGVSVEERDTVSLELFDSVMSDPQSSIAACGRLQHIVPFASCSLIQGIACSGDVWLEHQVHLRANVAATGTGKVPFALLDQYSPLCGIVPSMLRCVRTSQLIHLLASSVELNSASAAVVGRPLLHAARVQEVLAEPTRRLLVTKLLPRVLLSISSPKEVDTLLLRGEEVHKLLFTLAVVIRDTAVHSSGDAFNSSVRCIVSTITQWIAEAALLHVGDAPTHEEAIRHYRALFSTLDEAADIVGDSFLAKVPSGEAASAIQESMCMIPTLHPNTGLLAMTLHRHLSHLPVVRGDTVRQVIDYARKKKPLDGLEFLAELTSSRIIDTEAYNELVRVFTRLLASSFRLRHMPPNNCLVSQAPNDAPISLCDTQRAVVAVVSARRGINLHNRVDDTLRSSINLVLFDAVAGSVVSLKQANEEELSLMTKLIAFTSNCLSDLGSSDVTVLRASEVSVTKVAAVMNYAYQWLCATSITRLDSIGMETVTSAIRAIALLSNLTLVRSGFVLLPIMRQITGRRSMKDIREEFSSKSPAKAIIFRRQAAVIAKTNKQKLTLFPHLLAWCVTLSGPVQERVSKEWREEVFQLLDVLCALLLSPAVPGSKRVENTYLCNGNGSSGAGEQLGFEIIALTRPNAADPMRELAKGAAAVFALLLQSSTLSIVKSWLETVERKLQDYFYTFVEEHLSPCLIRESLLMVLSKNPTGGSTFDVNERYTVSVCTLRNRITLKYTVEDTDSTVHIEFKPDFPLRPPVVTCEKTRGCGVSADKWHVWMRKMTVLLFGGSSNVWDCVMLFGRNMDEHFSGKDPCPICFAIVSASSNRLPDMQCAVCRNSAIHSDCLYSWWATGGRTVCPLCRSPWVAT